MTDATQYILICYGDSLGYHHGAKYQLLRSYQWIKNRPIKIVTDKPDLFAGYPVTVLPLNENQKADWSLNQFNHFGIKLLGLQLAAETAGSDLQASILLDTDMYWIKDPSHIGNRLSSGNIALYQNEGLIIGSKNKSIQRYSEGLNDRQIAYSNRSYSLSKASEMWGSAVIGINHADLDILTESFDLFSQLAPLVHAHTIEQFALSEVTRMRNMRKIACKQLVADWSSIGKKNYATPVLSKFFNEYGEYDFETHLRQVNTIPIQRPMSVWLKQKFDRWKKQ